MQLPRKTTLRNGFSGDGHRSFHAPRPFWKIFLVSFASFQRPRHKFEVVSAAHRSSLGSTAPSGVLKDRQATRMSMFLCKLSRIHETSIT